MWELNNHGTVEVESESIEEAEDMEWLTRIYAQPKS
jgi:hypothetical protein